MEGEPPVDLVGETAVPVPRLSGRVWRLMVPASL